MVIKSSEEENIEASILPNVQQDDDLNLEGKGLNSAPLEIRTCPGKGQGMFALREISPGDLILREKPLIVMPDGIFSLDDPDLIENWLDKKINKLSCPERESFFNLSDCHVRIGSGETKTALGIFYTNNMSFIDESAALFVNIAKANHSCAANADFITRQHLGVQDVIAVKKISKGEEITLSYLSSKEEGLDVRQVRQDYLAHWYGFRCICKPCSFQDELLEEDERVRRFVKQNQEIGIDNFPLSLSSEFLTSLGKTNAKLPYQLEVRRVLLQRAIEENDILLTAQILVSALLINDIVGLPDAENIWNNMLLNPYFNC